MQIENDLSISYSWADNEPLLSDEEGWVTALHRLLGIRVRQLFGVQPRIWRDVKVRRNDDFTPEILKQIVESHALVSVVTPNYVRSRWCLSELSEFHSTAQQNGGVRIGNKNRIFKVLKTPVRDAVPKEFQPPSDGYQFYTLDEAGTPRELSLRSSTFDAFKKIIDDLAYDITLLLEILNPKGPSPEARRKVFLAETSLDLREDRDAIRRELVHNQFEVRPYRSLPLDAAELETFLRDELADCELSIHLIGRNYGVVPEGGSISTIEIQQRIATEVASAKGLRSLVWMPESLIAVGEQQRAFIERLRTDPAVHAAAELLEVPIEDLKTRIHSTLSKPEPRPTVAPDSDLTRVYLICDQGDVDATRELGDALFDRGYEVVRPIFHEDEAQARLLHEGRLKSCHAAILFHGRSGQLWLEQKLVELRKSVGLGREKPWLARAIYLAPPLNTPKEQLRTREVMIAREPAEGFSVEVLQPFFDAIESKRDPS